MAILSIEHLSKEFYIHNAQKRIRSCQDITLRLQEGEFIGIVGLSGAGKSTILKCIHRTYLATTGSIVHVWPLTTDLELVMMSLVERVTQTAVAVARAEEMLRYFRLPENLWSLYPNTFSGGERLRLNLAHTMVKQPRLMLLDEPTASLDNKTKVLVKDMLMQLKEKGKSMVGIFHDLEFMDGLCDKVFNISEGTLQ